MNDPEADARRARLTRWFVEYNPLYLASASCMLSGVLMISNALEKARNPFAEVWLSLVLLVYEAALISGAAALFRRGQVRAAAMLGMLEVAYLADPTLQTEQLATLAPWSVVLSLLWAVLFTVKLGALAWALRLRLPRRLHAVLGAGAGLVAVMPWCLHQRVVDTGLVLGAGMLALTALVLIGRRAAAITSREPLSPAAAELLRRCILGAGLFVAAMLTFHLGFWLLGLSGRHLVVVLVMVTLCAIPFVTTETSAWALWAFAMLVAAIDLPATTWAACLCAALILADGARRFGPRFLVGAIVCLLWGLLAMPTIAEVPGLSLVAKLAGAVALLVLAHQRREFTALVALSLGIAWTLFRARFWQDFGLLEMGGVLVVGSFGLLGLGVLVSWRPKP